VWLYFLDPRVRKIRNDASSCPWIFSTTLRSSIYYVASSPGSPFFLVFGVRVVILLLTNSKVREYQNVLFRSHFQQLDADVSGERPHRREDLLPHGWRQVLGSCRFCELLCRFFLNLMNGSSPPPETVLPGKVERALRYEFMCKMGGPPDFRYCNGEWCKHVENVSLFCFVSILRPHIFKHRYTQTHTTEKTIWHELQESCSRHLWQPGMWHMPTLLAPVPVIVICLSIMRWLGCCCAGGNWRHALRRRCASRLLPHAGLLSPLNTHQRACSRTRSIALLGVSRILATFLCRRPVFSNRWYARLASNHYHYPWYELWTVPMVTLYNTRHDSLAMSLAAGAKRRYTQKRGGKGVKRPERGQEYLLPRRTGSSVRQAMGRRI